MICSIVQQMSLWKLIIGITIGFTGYVLLASKNYVNQNHKRGALQHNCILVASSVFTVATMPILLITFISLWLYRNCIKGYLKIRYTKSFGGLLNGTDAVWALEKNSRSIINVLLIVECTNTQQELLESLKDIIKTKILSNKQINAKLLSSLERDGPYFFLLNNQINVDDCVNKFEINTGSSRISREDLRKYLSKIRNSELPRGHKALWEMKVGCQEVSWVDNEKAEKKNEKVYPIIFRFHHSLLDGSTFLKFFVSFLGKSANIASYSIQEPHKPIYNSNNSNEVKLFSKSKCISKNCGDLILIFKEILQNINIKNCLYYISNAAETLRYVVWFIPHIFMLASREGDLNVLNRPNSLTRHHDVAWFSESKPKYVNMIKEVKHKLKDVTFSDVIFTAIAGSLNKYFQRHSNSIPNQVTSAVPIIAEIPELQGIIPGKYDVDTVIFQNKFSMIVLNLPTSSTTNTDLGDPIVNKLLQTKINSTNTRKSVEPRINYWIMAFLGKYLPTPILTRGLEVILRSITLAISNLQGPTTIEFSNNILVKDIIFWIPLQLNTGVGFSILTYEGRLQLGLAVEKSLLSSPQDVQILLDDVIKELETIFEKVNCLSK